MNADDAPYGVATKLSPIPDPNDHVFFFEMNVRLEGHFYIVVVPTAEGQSAELLAAVKAVVDAAKALSVAVGIIRDGE
jgi:hypothetical protein